MLVEVAPVQECFTHIDPIEGTETCVRDSGNPGAQGASLTSTRLRVLKRYEADCAKYNLARFTHIDPIEGTETLSASYHTFAAASFTHIDPIEGTETGHAPLPRFHAGGFTHIDPIEGTET